MPAKIALIVPFFGRPAKTFSSAASLSMRTGAKVHLGYVWRRPDQSLALVFSPVFTDMVTDDFNEDVRRATAQYTAAIETVVREHPECWLWMHRRWRPL